MKEKASFRNESFHLPVYFDKWCLHQDWRRIHWNLFTESDHSSAYIMIKLGYPNRRRYLKMYLLWQIVLNIFPNNTFIKSFSGAKVVYRYTELKVLVLGDIVQYALDRVSDMKVITTSSNDMSIISHMKATLRPIGCQTTNQHFKPRNDLDW